MKALLKTNNKNTMKTYDLVMDSLLFSGGEEHLRFEKPALSTDEVVQKIEVHVALISSAKIMQLLLAIDALRRLFGTQTPLELVCPYFPYARQDRVCNEGEALSARVMADLINAMNFSKVTIWDAHSDVTPALINNVVNLPQHELIAQHKELSMALRSGSYTLVAPDSGATKKTQNLAKAFDGLNVVQAEKVRDTLSGQIVGTEIRADLQGLDLLIVDDICDGGRTFIELAKVARAKGCRSVSLYITHGIFSKGREVLSGLIDQIYTSNDL